MRYIYLLLITNLALAQQTQSVDFKSVLGEISVNPIEKTVSGSVVFDFKVLKSIDTIRIDAQNFTISDLKINGKTVKYSTSSKFLKLFEGYKNGSNKLEFIYLCKPKQTIYFNKIGEKHQIFTQGQGKYTSHWFPSFDDVNEKLIFNLDINFYENYQVISNGILKSKTINDNSILWQYRMQKPMSSYLLMLAIGEFESKTIASKTGKPLQFFIEKEDFNKFDATYIYSKQMFDFFETEIGVEFPWQIYKQIPVRDFLYAGMENTTATIFARDFVVDSIGFNDKNYINVNAHELAHQWFGNLITAKSGKHHWLQEGFATYFALLAEKDIYGENHFNYKMFQTAQQLKYASKTDTIPVMNEKASSLSFYQKGAWALRILDEAIGHEKFKKIVKNYLKKYKFKNVETADFLAEINKISDFDTKSFQETWLEKPGFEMEIAKEILSKNATIKQYFDVSEMSKKTYSENKEIFETILKSNAYYPIKQQIINQLSKVLYEDKKELLQIGMATNDVKIRQTIAKSYKTNANSFKTIPIEFKTEFETLLDDNSYITKEIVLSRLWMQFPEDQFKLLDKTQSWKGFNDLNLRILWLNLALQTKDYQANNKLQLYDELIDYASSKYDTETRQNALENLIYLNKNDINYLPHLVNGMTHYRWQFVGFCRTKVREYLKDNSHRAYFENLLPNLNEVEKFQLERLLKENK